MEVELICEACGRRSEYVGDDPPRFCGHCGQKLSRMEETAVAPPVVVPPPVVTLPPVVVMPPVIQADAVPPAKEQEPEIIALQPAPSAEEPRQEALELEPADDAEAVTAGDSEGDIEIAPETPENDLEATRCPNCGQDIHAGAEICTACGYSRRLGRTLTTRVGSPEIPRHKSEVAAAPAKAAEEEPQVEAERIYAGRSKRRKRTAGGSAETIRLFVAAMFTLLLVGGMIAVPFGLLRHAPVALPDRMAILADSPLRDTAVLLVLYLLIVVPITTLGVRLGASMSGVEIPSYLTFLRVAGTLSAVIVTADVIFTTNEYMMRLAAPWSYATIGGEAAIALLIFTWYLHSVRIGGALTLWLYTVVFLAIAGFAAAAAYAPVAKFAGVNSPVIPPAGEWFKGATLPG